MEKSERFSGQGSIEQFLQKVDVHCALKAYDTEEKKAQALAAKLNGVAFEVYMRMSNDDKKEYTTLKEELRKEFKKGTASREDALKQLSVIKYREGSIKTYAYEVMELVKLAYPDFDAANRQIVAKDGFLGGLHADIQVSLKTKYPKMNEVALDDLAKEAQRLEIVGVKTKSYVRTDIDAVDLKDEASADALVEKISRKVAEVLKLDDTEEVNYHGRGWSQGRGRNRGRGRGTSRRGNRTGQTEKKCWCCNSSEHLSKNCPMRFCRNCGEKGHDPWDQRRKKKL